MKKMLLTISTVLYGFCAYTQDLPLTGGTLTGTLVISGAPFVLAAGSSNIMAAGSSATVIGSGSGTDHMNYVYGNNPFSIWTNNQNRLTVSGSGDVGIGTSTPSSKLTIDGNSATNGSLAISNGSSYFTWDFVRSGHDLQIGRRSSAASSTFYNTLALDGNGKVGIGTTSPTYGLDLNLQTVTSNSNIGYNVFADATGNVGYSGYNLQLNNTSGNASAYFRLARTSATAYLGMEVGSQSRDGIRLLTGTIIPTEVMRIDASGKVGIGTTSPDEKLTVKGNIHAAEVKVEALSAIPDYVFEHDYKLISLTELKTYVDQNHHLPEIPSAKEIEKDGIKVGDMSMKLLKTIEELTLHVIELNNQVKLQKEKINSLENQLKK